MASNKGKGKGKVVEGATSKVDLEVEMAKEQEKAVSRQEFDNLLKAVSASMKMEMDFQKKSAAVENGLKKLLGTLREKIDRLENERKCDKSEITDLRTQIEELQSKCVTDQNGVKAVLKMLNKKVDELDSERSESADLRKENGHLRKEIHDLRKENGALRVNMGKFEREIKSVEYEMKDLQKNSNARFFKVNKRLLFQKCELSEIRADLQGVGNKICDALTEQLDLTKN